MDQETVRTICYLARLEIDKDKAEKIRTYNFPQGRITDHRIKLTQHNLDQVMDGDMISICQALITENQLAQLSNLEESS